MPKPPHPPICPRDFYGAQTDKHSDLTSEKRMNYGNGCCSGFAPRFPYPRTVCPVLPLSPGAASVYSFVCGNYSAEDAGLQSLIVYNYYYIMINIIFTLFAV